MPLFVQRHRWYLIGLGMVAAATVLTMLAKPWLGPSIGVFFFPAVVITAIYGGYAPGLVTALTATAVGVFFVPPDGVIDFGIDGGGGHARVGAISFDVAHQEAAREAAQEIVQELRASVRAQGT